MVNTDTDTEQPKIDFSSDEIIKQITPENINIAELEDDNGWK